MLNRVKLNEKQVALVREMANCYEEIIRASNEDTATKHVTQVYASKRISWIKEKLGIKPSTIETIDPPL